MAQDCTKTIRAFYDAFFQQDVPGFVALLDPQVEWTSAENMPYADRSPYVGVDAVVDLIFRRLRVDWDDFVMSAQEILGRDDLVIANGRFQGIYKANGIAIDAQFVQVFQLKDGKVAKCQMYTDTAKFKDSVSGIRAAGGA